nr:MAG TPA: hypothetical protein [Caudoviricetes sp.]
MRPRYGGVFSSALRWSLASLTSIKSSISSLPSAGGILKYRKQ